MRFVLIISRERIKVSGSSGAQTNHAKRSYVTLKPPKMTPPEEPNRHGHTVLIQAVANGCERLRTVANGCEWLRTVGQHQANTPPSPDPHSETGTLATHSGKSYSRLNACVHACMYACMQVCMCSFMHACMVVCLYLCIFVSLYACMRVCMYVCMHACMHKKFFLPYSPNFRHKHKTCNN